MELVGCPEQVVTPAKAGIQVSFDWIPAFAE
jgi:hypothetical protein